MKKNVIAAAKMSHILFLGTPKKSNKGMIRSSYTM